MKSRLQVKFKILKTIDGGANWVAQTSGISESLFSVHFIDNNTGFVVGNSGRLLKTTNGGTNWNVLFSGTSLDLKTVYFATATIGYIAGVSGQIRKTINGGTNWTQLTNNINIVLTSLAFKDANNGYAVGYDYNHYGKIYNTTNGGTNWSVETISYDHDLNSVNYADPNTVYIVGINGTILKSILGSISASSNGPVCAGSQLSLSASTITGATYNWSGPNGFTSTLQNPIITASSTTNMSGTYHVTASINGCSNLSESTTVLVSAIPANLLPNNNGPVCAGNQLSLSAATITGATYNWTGPNGFTSTLQSPIIASSSTTNMSGNYNVTASVNGCNSLAESTTILVNATPNNLLPNNNGPVCEASQLALSAATIAGATYNWTGPNGFTSTLQNPIIASSSTTNMSGTYLVTASVNGCTSTNEFTTVLVNAVPLAPIVSNNGPVCEANQLALSASTIPGATYNWTGPNGFTSTLQNPIVSTNVTNNMAGNYNVTASLNGCTSANESTIVLVNPVPLAPVISNNGPITEGDTLVLSASTINGASYSWFGPNGFSSSQQSPTVITNVSLAMWGNYFVSVTVNGCTSVLDSTLVIVNTTVDVADKLNKSMVSIYPNPSNDKISIELQEVKGMKMKAINNLGECVLEGDLYVGVSLIDIGFLTNGMYNFIITSGKEIYHQKLIKY